MIKYKTSTGEVVSQATINKERAEAYIKYDLGVRVCAGCGGQAQGRAHIIAQARCKSIHKTDYIWQPWNWFIACHRCNQNWEGFKGDACKKLLNYEECLQVLKEHDYYTFLKYTHLPA